MILDFDDLPDLVEYCLCTDGWIYFDGQPIQCPYCKDINGRRKRPTAFGRAVLELVKQFGGLDLPKPK